MSPPSARTAAVAHLDRIGFLLERSAAATPRVKAYRRAGELLEAMTDAELDEHVRRRSLRELPGIGPSTETVVMQSASGAVPDKLVQLEAELTPLVDGGERVRAALLGDLHSHTRASDGGSPLEVMARTAAAIGHRYLAVTDHSPRLTVANGLSAERLEAQLEEIDAVQARLDADGLDLRVLSGIEVDILDDGSLDQTPELLGHLDVVVASAHSKLRMGSRDMTARLVAAAQNPLVDVLGHCTGRLLSGRKADSPGASRGTGGRPESEFDAEAVFAACAESGTAVEINARPERLDPPMRLLRLAVQAGCVFSIDSDAHAPGQLDWQVHGCARAEEADVATDRIVNTWGVERLLAWTG